MRLDNIWVVVKREYLQRIKSKGFWIGTVLLPLLLLAMAVLPSLILARSEASQEIVVVDLTGRVAAELRAGVPRTPREAREEKDPVRRARRSARFDMEFEAPGPDPTAQRAALDRRVLDEEIDAWVWIGRDVFAGGKVEYHARSVSNFLTQEVLQDEVSAAVRRVRLHEAGLDPSRIAALTEAVELSTLRVSEEGSRAEEGFAGAAFAYILFMLLYMTLGLWGQQVLTGVLEEKGSRIVEVLVSTLRPFELMMGKLVGICLLGLTQIAIWLTTLLVISAPGVMAALVALPEGTNLPTLTPGMAIHFALLFALGFFVFSTLYAAVGAAFNNVQEAQQVSGFLALFLFAPVFIMFRVINDPSSSFAVVASLIPPFTPLLMSLRIALQMPPLWQILLGYALTAAFVCGMVWISARIYRIGILMYGKKPTLQELWRWVRYA